MLNLIILWFCGSIFFPSQTNINSLEVLGPWRIITQVICYYGQLNKNQKSLTTHHCLPEYFFQNKVSNAIQGLRHHVLYEVHMLLMEGYPQGYPQAIHKLTAPLIPPGHTACLLLSAHSLAEKVSARQFKRPKPQYSEFLQAILSTIHK